MTVIAKTEAMLTTKVPPSWCVIDFAASSVTTGTGEPPAYPTKARSGALKGTARSERGSQRMSLDHQCYDVTVHTPD